MEFEASDLLGQAQAAATSNGIYISAWDSASIDALPRPQQARLAAIVDAFGRLSAKAQGLPAPVTDLARTRLHGHVLYLASTVTGSRSQVLGGLKIGCKRLFLHSPHSNKYLEMSPDCVLDFYVHESCQRSGIGRSLLETSLQESGKTAAMLAYDRPSPKLKSFLAKHYGLTAYQPQINNYVVFNEFFQTEAAQQRSTPRKVLLVEAIASQLGLGPRSASSPPVISPPQPQAAAPPAAQPGRQAVVRPSSSAVDIRSAGADAEPTASPAASSLPADRVTPPPVTMSISRSPPPAVGMAVRPAGISQGPPAGQWRMPATASLACGLSAPPVPAEARPPLPAVVVRPSLPAAPAPTGVSQRTPARSQSDAGAATHAGQSLSGSTPPVPIQQPQQQAGASPALARQPATQAPAQPLATPVAKGCSTPVGSPLRTPWALHNAEDTKEIVARLQPAARRADLIRSPVRRALQPFQLSGSVATR